MSEEVGAIIRAAVEDHGPISFAEFMEHALYGPGGFYERPPVGAGGHFVTSPHVHPVFGELLGRGLREVWESLGRPDPFRVVEVGAGDGTLATQILGELEGVPLGYVAVERSPGARVALGELATEDARVGVAAHLEEAGPIDGGCILANELLDNLPFHRVRAGEDELAEVRIGWENGVFTEVEVACDEALAAYCPKLEPAQEAAVSPEALGFVEKIAGSMTRGHALLIDYGAASGGPTGPVHGYREHRVVEGVLEDPGSADVTAGVDFGALARRAASRGLTPLGPVAQQGALITLGFEDWMRSELARQGDLLRSGSGTEAVRTWGGRSRASLLIDPAGLGQLGWLTLSTPGLPPPPWAPDEARPPQPSTD